MKLNRQAGPAPGNKPKHRYAGLLICGECKSPFVPVIRRWRGKLRVEYICREYQLHGKSYCTSHRIREEVLDANVQHIAQNLRYNLEKQQEQLNEIKKLWALRKPILSAHIASFQTEIGQLEEEIETILMEKIRG